MQDQSEKRGPAGPQPGDIERLLAELREAVPTSLRNALRGRGSTWVKRGTSDFRLKSRRGGEA